MASAPSGSPVSGPSGATRLPQLQTYLKAAETALRAGNVPQAMRIAGEAADKGFEHPNILVLAAYHNLNLNQFSNALDCAARARQLAPRNVDVLNALGTCLVRLGRSNEAIAVFDEALRQAPALFVTRFNRANALEMASEVKRAREQFLRALECKPGHAETMARIAHLAAQCGDMKEAREYGARALKIDPRQNFARFALAAAEMDAGNNGAVEPLLTPVLRDPAASPLAHAIAHSLMGDGLDGLGRYAEAFAAYTQAGNAFRALYASQFEKPGTESALLRVQRLTHYFRNAPDSAWRNISTGAFVPPVETHVFLLSFPRSGTTLLEQVLAAHPAMEAMDERDCLIDSHAFLLEGGGLEKLAALDGEALDSLRAAYWKRVRDAGAAHSKPVFVDKMPLNSVLLCLIAKLFPRAKILFALRDPRDVVFSCFRRRFGMTQQMYELLTLNGTAVYYDAVMTLAAVYRGKLALEFFDTRYEDLVSDFAGETQRLCCFLGVTHSAEMENFAPKARARNIDTPSAAQVGRGLFTQGAGQWRAYRDVLSPVLPIIAPWIAHYGYPD